MYAPLISPNGQIPTLSAELVPSDCWVSTVRSYLSEHYWRKLSTAVAEQAQRRCEICSGRGRQHAVECHEVWGYDDDIHLQGLLRLQALCPLCHRVKHLGRSIEFGYEEEVLGWLARVNGWDARTTNWYVDAVFTQCHERSRHEWALDLTTLGENYEISLERLELPRYTILAVERRQLLHHREISIEDIYDRNGNQVSTPGPRHPLSTRKEGF